MKKIEFVKYETPLVEVIEVEVEKGFEVSPGGVITPVQPG